MFLLRASELDDDEDKWQQCCGCLHVWIVCWCFLVSDFFFLFWFTLGYAIAVSNDPHWSNILPLVAFGLSWPFCFLGFVAWYRRQIMLTKIYAGRTALVSLWCVVWSFVSMSIPGFGNDFLGVLWLLGCPIYAYGGYLALRTANFFKAM